MHNIYYNLISHDGIGNIGPILTETLFEGIKFKFKILYGCSRRF